MKEYFVKIDRDFSIDGLNIVIGYYEDKHVYILHGETFDEYNRESRVVPTLHIPFVFDKEQNIINQIVDGLIEQGGNPSKPIKNNEELNAIKYHLEDMRKLVFRNEDKK